MGAILSTSPSSIILEGDCVEEMAKMPADSVDAIVTDPPYGLEFMGKDWDKLAGIPGYNERGRITNRPDSQVPYGRGGGVNSYQAGKPMQEWHETWTREAFRVLKPGGHLLAFSGTRTAHRMVCAIEDAGFEIRDSLHWIYGSGFPKSLDVSKQLDKMAGAEREVIGKGRSGSGRESYNGHNAGRSRDFLEGEYDTTVPATEAAQQWQGWGTALKPAHENICVARKPLSEASVARNVLKHGTGAINVDGCRVGPAADTRRSKGNNPNSPSAFPHSDDNWIPHVTEAGQVGKGRWPPNLLLSHHPDCKPTGEVRRVKAGDPNRFSKAYSQGNGHEGWKRPAHDNYEPPVVTTGDPDGTEPQEVWICHESCPIRLLDEQSGQRSGASSNSNTGDRANTYGKGWAGTVKESGYADQGGASRFFPRFEPALEDEAPFRYVAKASRAERNKGLGEEAGMVNSHPT